MATTKEIKKVCKAGHVFYKSSGCLTCPKCEAMQKSEEGFLSLLSAPARRAMENNRINNLTKLSTYSEKEILMLHGVGKSSIPILNRVLGERGLSFRSDYE